MDRLLIGGRIPRMDALKAESQAVEADKKTAYREYRAAKNDMQGCADGLHTEESCTSIEKKRYGKWKDCKT